jgi:hypothetical protein
MQSGKRDPDSGLESSTLCGSARDGHYNPMKIRFSQLYALPQKKLTAESRAPKITWCNASFLRSLLA